MLDLANDEPQVRIETVAPGLSKITSRPRQPVRVGHVSGSVLDPGMYIATNGEVFDPEDADAVFIDAECSDCDSALAVLPNQERGAIWYVIEHRRTCPAMAQWIRDQR